MELFRKISNDRTLLTISARKLILDVSQGVEYAYEYLFKVTQKTQNRCCSWPLQMTLNIRSNLNRFLNRKSLLSISEFKTFSFQCAEFLFLTKISVQIRFHLPKIKLKNLLTYKMST